MTSPGRNDEHDAFSKAFLDAFANALAAETAAEKKARPHTRYLFVTDKTAFLLYLRYLRTVGTINDESQMPTRFMGLKTRRMNGEGYEYAFAEEIRDMGDMGLI